MFDPRHNQIRDTLDPKTIYGADLFLNAIFYEERFDIESEGIDWSKVLPKAVQGVIY